MPVVGMLQKCVVVPERPYGDGTYKLPAREGCGALIPPTLLAAHQQVCYWDRLTGVQTICACGQAVERKLLASHRRTKPCMVTRRAATLKKRGMSEAVGVAQYRLRQWGVTTEYDTLVGQIVKSWAQDLFYAVARLADGNAYRITNEPEVEAVIRAAWARGKPSDDERGLIFSYRLRHTTKDTL